MSVKRFDYVNQAMFGDTPDYWLEEVSDGDYVEYTDYLTLQSELSAVRAELREAISMLGDSHCPYCDGTWQHPSCDFCDKREKMITDQPPQGAEQ
jgi:hypothetical protein